MRRKRWTVTMVAPHTGAECIREILGYDSESVQRWYERRGYTVVSVERTPNRKRSQQPIGTKKFVVDQKALAEAIEFLGIQQPVVIRFNSRYGGTAGNYQFRSLVHATNKDWAEVRPAQTFHRIMIKGYLSVEQASRTLWHELAHAMQAERESGNPTEITAIARWSKADIRSRRISYRHRPCEIEAREHENLHEDHPLTKPVDKR